MKMTTNPARDLAEPAVVLRGASRSYGDRVAVHPMDLALRRGETVALLGPNGAGKSTTIGMMLGLTAPDAGSLAVAGLAPRQAVARGAIAGMLQDAGFMPGVRVRELVRLAERSYPDPLPTAQALELAGLEEVATRRVDRLSGGQAQRLRFAIAIVANTGILILDEPTRALDVPGRAAFWESMRRFARAGKTILFATHYLDEVEGNAQRVIVLANGRIVADGTPSEIRGRAGVSTIGFTLDEGAGRVGEGDAPGATVPRLRSLPGVRGVERSGSRVRLMSSDPDATVRALARGALAWRDLELVPPRLDDSFLLLTESGAAPEAETAALTESANAADTATVKEPR